MPAERRLRQAVGEGIHEERRGGRRGGGGRARAAEVAGGGGGAAVATGKQKAATAAAGRPGSRNRQALGDIGNVLNAHVVDGKIQLPEGINRPITRSFGAQLLKKAQENAVGANKIPVRKEPAPKPAKKVVPRLENAAKASTGAGVNENKKPSESEGAGSSGSGGGSAHKYSRKKVVNTLNNCAYCSFQARVWHY
ncbi:cyclin-B1-5-like isoform X2 [Oryza sativa Japonica Group]|uniref:Uncharacterized protein n=1 Tax=Oryza glaberrima TaxID=4538 RepID=I1PX08_ORYGL